MITVHKNNIHKGDGLVALIKEYSHPYSPVDTWAVLLKQSRPNDLNYEFYGDRPPNTRAPWPGKHGVLIWEGGDLDRNTETQISQSISSSPFQEGETWLEASFAPRNRRRRREPKGGDRSDSEKEGGGRSDTST